MTGGGEEFSDAHVNQLIILTQTPPPPTGKNAAAVTTTTTAAATSVPAGAASTGTGVSQRQDRGSGPHTSRSKMVQEFTKIIDDGLRLYENQMWTSRERMDHDQRSFQKVGTISQEDFERLKSGAPPARPVQRQAVPPAPPRTDARGSPARKPVWNVQKSHPVPLKGTGAVESTGDTEPRSLPTNVGMMYRQIAVSGLLLLKTRDGF